MSVTASLVAICLPFIWVRFWHFVIIGYDMGMIAGYLDRVGRMMSDVGNMPVLGMTGGLQFPISYF